LESAINVKSQAPIPKALDHQVKLFLHPNGSVVLLPKLPVSALRGMLKVRRRPVTVKEMREATAAVANEDASQAVMIGLANVLFRYSRLSGYQQRDSQ
jgi:hypothetical protein